MKKFILFILILGLSHSEAQSQFLFFKKKRQYKVSDTTVMVTMRWLNGRSGIKRKDLFIQKIYNARFLYTRQIQFLASRLQGDEALLREYQLRYAYCIDKAKFPELARTFSSDMYAQQFNSWLQSQTLGRR